MVVGPAFLGVGFWPFLLGLRAGPPFSDPSVFLMLVVGPSFYGLRLAFPCSSGVGPSFLECGPSFLGFGLALPFLLGVRAGPPFSGPSVFLMLVVGPSFLGLGLAFPCPGRSQLNDAEPGPRHGWQQVSLMTLEECFGETLPVALALTPVQSIGPPNLLAHGPGCDLWFSGVALENVWSGSVSCVTKSRGSGRKETVGAVRRSK